MKPQKVRLYEKQIQFNLFLVRLIPQVNRLIPHKVQWANLSSDSTYLFQLMNFLPMETPWVAICLGPYLPFLTFFLFQNISYLCTGYFMARLIYK
jgi:hypothetical protein